MEVKVGCDLVEIERVRGMSSLALGKVFLNSEIQQSAESLAGVFAVKESCKKVFPDLDWKDIEVKKKKDGKPVLILHVDKEFLSCDISISHEKEYAMASVVFLID